MATFIVKTGGTDLPGVDGHLTVEGKRVSRHNIPKYIENIKEYIQKTEL